MNRAINNAALSVAVAAAAFVPTKLLASSPQPNIIMILIDDVGYGDLSCYGNRYHNTPNIDRLAAEGVRFTDFHTNGTVSSPTRCALMTGRYQQYSGIEGVVTAADHRDCGLPLESTTIASLLSEVGYDCAIYGKWHLGYHPRYNPTRFGFDEFVGYVSGNVDYFSHIDQAGYEDWWHNDTLTKEDGYTTYLITDYAERYIEREREAPFFLYLPYETTHGPYQGPNDRPIRSLVNGELVSNKNYSDDEPKDRYKSMLEAFDECVGRLMESIESRGIADNTLIIFCSDNGGAATLSCNAPLSGHKSTLFEGGHRVSAMTYWRGVIEGGRECDETLMTFDIMPTICDICDISLKGVEHDGVSFRKTMMKGRSIKERTLFWRTYKGVAARSGDWKLLIDRVANTTSLYNLASDIAEQSNVADQHPEIVERLTSEIAEWEAQFKEIKMEA